jgi:IS30 family transposase
MAEYRVYLVDTDDHFYDAIPLICAEREVISRGVTAHRSARSIAKLLGRSPSSV